MVVKLARYLTITKTIFNLFFLFFVQIAGFGTRYSEIDALAVDPSGHLYGVLSEGPDIVDPPKFLVRFNAPINNDTVHQTLGTLPFKEVYDMEFSPSGNELFLVVGDPRQTIGDADIAVWDVATRLSLRNITLPESIRSGVGGVRVNSIAFTSTGQLAVIALLGDNSRSL